MVPFSGRDLADRVAVDQRSLTGKRLAAATALTVTSIFPLPISLARCNRTEYNMKARVGNSALLQRSASGTVAYLPILVQVIKAFLGTSAALGSLTVLFRLLLTKQVKEYKLISDPNLVSRRIKSSQSDYDPEEYDVVIIGGGACFV